MDNIEPSQQIRELIEEETRALRNLRNLPLGAVERARSKTRRPAGNSTRRKPTTLPRRPLDRADLVVLAALFLIPSLIIFLVGWLTKFILSI